MPTTNDRFAVAIKAGYSRMGFKSVREAGRIAGIDPSAVGKMLKGEVPGKGLVVRWAVAVQESINDLLSVAGYEPLSEDAAAAAISAGNSNRSVNNYTQTIFPVPEAVQQAIQEAPDKESKIEIAWEYIRRPEFGLKMGAYKIHEVDDRAKVIIIRMLENLQGGELLPAEIV